MERQEDGVVEGEYSAGWAQASRPHKALQQHPFLHNISLNLCFWLKDLLLLP